MPRDNFLRFARWLNLRVPRCSIVRSARSVRIIIDSDCEIYRVAASLQKYSFHIAEANGHPARRAETILKGFDLETIDVALYRGIREPFI